MIQAVVKNGRLVLDEPSDLPDGTVVKLGVVSPSTIASDVLGLVDHDLQPAIRAIYRLWQAVGDGQPERTAACRAQLLAAVDRVQPDRFASRDAVREAQARLLETAATEIRPQHLSSLELALFGARLPQPPEDEYGAQDEPLDCPDVGESH